MGTLMTVKVIGTPFLGSPCMVACIASLLCAFMQHFPFPEKAVCIQTAVDGTEPVVLIAVPMFVVPQTERVSCYLGLYQKAEGRGR